MDNRAGDAIAASRPFSLGEVRVEFEGTRVLLSGPPGEGVERQLEPTIGALRRHVRVDERGRYRPLSGARTLPRGWRVSLPAERVRAALDAVYPQALLHQEQAAEGRLRTVSFDDVVRRQRGRYRLAGKLTAQGRDRAKAVLCGRCVRTPVWADPTAESSEIPCPEPCSVLLALSREAALWQEERPDPTAPNPTIPFADFSAAGNELREAYLAGVPVATPSG